MSRIAPTSSMFDPHYHTMERVRQSPVLLTAILSAAALFLRPDIADQLRKLADLYITRKMLSSHYDLTLIQAILVLVYWKHPNDRTTYQKMGMAVRLVHELRMQRPSETTRTLKSPMTEDEERRKVDIERTVQCECRWYGHVADSFRVFWCAVPYRPSNGRSRHCRLVRPPAPSRSVNADAHGRPGQCLG